MSVERKIKIMPEELVAKIAAGEVIERPASIVKELIENSIDAGATEIVVDLEKGGKMSIRVTDNGCGIGKDEVALAFCRNASSKVYEFEDIFRIRSLGFRGEALYSIATIARVEMYTKVAGAAMGTKIVVEGGDVKEITDAGCPQGTSVRISRIFAATPVRMKFLKADATELGHCTDAVIRSAIANPKIRVTISVNGKSFLTVPRTENCAERIALVLGDHVEREVVNAENADAAIKLRAYLSPPRFTMSNARGMMFYVNGRYVRDGLLHNAVMSAYRRLIEPRRYPSAIIFLDCLPEEIDINVHPTKREIRFKNPSTIFELVSVSISDKLSSPRHGNASDEYAVVHETRTVEEGGTVKDVGEGEGRYASAPSGDKKLSHEMQQSGSDAPYRLMPLRGERGLNESASFFSHLRYVGRVSGTYLLFVTADAIVIIDQHAAHERILFEKLSAQFRSKGAEAQRLLLPEVLTLSPAVYTALVDHLQLLNTLGFEIEPFGNHTVVVKTVPALLAHCAISIIVPDMIDELVKSGKSTQIESLQDTIAASLACRGAVKAGESLTEAEIERLCRDLDATRYSTSCPHGRPAFIVMNDSELERLFKR